MVDYENKPKKAKFDEDDKGKNVELEDDGRPKKVELEGIVAEKLPNNLFIVELDNSLKVLAHVSGRMKMNCINILPSDRVKVELNPNDKTKDGRFRAKIVFRSK
ncbi:MAG: translation initiation factor IF-1 [Spirobacillus cienkowskii]|jgi:translation initiation factor IF-1|uniref:Translation initiation factor IF-1 n=1 Tax=Spirobacillus cienkowskii TaxID=495820 RepID=A0A369KRU6_9BACT|nr:MAG: translation initiation factor IF-1 [Spirobacillus cienkowskii]